jgi:4-hydroxybenzoate polyprenyltransferase
LTLLGSVKRLRHGRAAFKAEIARKVNLDIDNLPVHTEFLAWLHQEAARGRELHLCSAAAQSIVERVSQRIGIFATATGSSAHNLKGCAKATHLGNAFPHGFAYAGDSAADLPVWEAAHSVILVNASPAIAARARRLGKPIEAEFSRPPLRPATLLGLVRAHHWSKNALIFAPLILGHAWNDVNAVIDVLLGLLCLLMVTSGTYVLNDIADLQADRLHWSKRRRAIASGHLPIATGLLLASGLVIAGFVGSMLVSLTFALVLGIYLLLTLAYSFRLKRVPLLDTLVIGVLFTTRLGMGIALLRQPVSEWLLAFSAFFFFSLAVAKRHTEIVRALRSTGHSLASRGYQVEDEPLTLVFGIASSVASLVIMILFIVQEVHQRNLYRHPTALWGIPLILAIWIGRIWLLAHRGKMQDDPVSFALRDRPSLALGAMVAALFVAAL